MIPRSEGLLGGAGVYAPAAARVLLHVAAWNGRSVARRGGSALNGHGDVAALEFHRMAAFQLDGIASVERNLQLVKQRTVAHLKTKDFSLPVRPA